MLYSFIFFHTIIQVNDPEASLSNTINKKPCKNTTQAGTNHNILLNSFFLYKNHNIYYFFFYQKYIFIFILFSNLYNIKIWQEYSYTSIVQYSYIFSTSIVAKFKWSRKCYYDKHTNVTMTDLFSHFSLYFWSDKKHTLKTFFTFFSQALVAWNPTPLFFLTFSLQINFQ